MHFIMSLDTFYNEAVEGSLLHYVQTLYKPGPVCFYYFITVEVYNLW